MLAIPLTYNFRSVFVRKGATLLTVSAIAFSVAVLVLVLALARGFESALAGTGDDTNVVLLRASATSEGVSGVSRGAARILTTDKAFARDETGRVLAEPEVYAAFSVARNDGGKTNIPVRGTGPIGLAIRRSVKVADGGRMFVPGRYELVVGSGLRGRLPGIDVGSEIDLAGYRWRIVGLLDAGGQAYDSEIWLDAEIFVRILDRSGFNTVIGRLADPASIADLRARVAEDPRLDVAPQTEREYFAKQAGALSIALKVLAWFLAVVMGVGAVAGATNTLLASVALRTREIGTLLAIGFSPRAIFVGFLIESVTLGVVGGALGVVLGWQCNGIATGTTNWATFTEQSFSFRVTSDVVVQAMVLSALIGLLGGALPARRAARMSPRAALRAV
jgi:putative ABC transport system permease protein